MFATTDFDTLLFFPEDEVLPKLECHFCESQLHEDNNAMTRCMSGQNPAARGFGWISVIVEPFREVPCCDICMEKPTDQLPGFLMA